MPPRYGIVLSWQQNPHIGDTAHNAKHYLKNVFNVHYTDIFLSDGRDIIFINFWSVKQVLELFDDYGKCIIDNISYRVNAKNGYAVKVEIVPKYDMTVWQLVRYLRERVTDEFVLAFSNDNFAVLYSLSFVSMQNIMDYTRTDDAQYTAEIVENSNGKRLREPQSISDKDQETKKSRYSEDTDTFLATIAVKPTVEATSETIVPEDTRLNDIHRQLLQGYIMTSTTIDNFIKPLTTIIDDKILKNEGDDVLTILKKNKAILSDILRKFDELKENTMNLL